MIRFLFACLRAYFSSFILVVKRITTKSFDSDLSFLYSCLSATFFNNFKRINRIVPLFSKTLKKQHSNIIFEPLGFFITNSHQSLPCCKSNWVNAFIGDVKLNASLPHQPSRPPNKDCSVVISKLALFLHNLIWKPVIILSVSIIIFSSAASFAQTVGDYRSAGSGNWTTPATWQIWNGTTWVAATTYPGQNAGSYAVNILAANTVTINTGLITLQMGTVTINGTLLINTNADATFRTDILTINSPGTIDWTGNAILTLPSPDAVINVTCGGLTGGCTGAIRIIVGTTQYKCGGADEFRVLMDMGGNGTVNGKSPICINETTTYTFDGTQGGTWTSSNTAVATVNATSGLVTGKTSGTSTITYTLTGCSGLQATASKIVTVNSSSAPTITTSGVVGAVCQSAGAQTTTLPYTATTNSPTSYSIDWNAAANTAGLADQGTTAFAFAAGVGNLNTVAITAGTPAGTYSGIMTITNNGGCSNTKAVTVIVNATPTITSTTFTVGVGKTITLTGSASPDASTPWKSATPTVATINNSGVVTGISAGTSEITYKNTNGCTKTVTVTVAEISVTKTSSSSLPAGAPILYTIVVKNLSLLAPADNPKITITDHIPNTILSPEYSLDGGPWTTYTDGIFEINNLQVRNYILLIRGEVDCAATGDIVNTASVVLSTRDNPNISNDVSTWTTTISSTVFKLTGFVTDVSLTGPTNGKINLIAEGGAPAASGYTYLWTGPGSFTSTSKDITGLSAGSYHVTVTDFYGCSTSGTFVVGTLGLFNFCVSNIISAIYDGQPEPAADIIPIGWTPGDLRRPDWYIVGAGSTELDITTLDNIRCVPKDLIINWTIDFSDSHPSISGTGQPSKYDDPLVSGSPNPITLWGALDYTEIQHTITYTITDCINSNNKTVKTKSIIIHPRPEINKLP